MVQLDGGLELDAVAPVGRGLAVGGKVRLRLDVTRIAGLTTDATHGRGHTGPGLTSPISSVE